MDAFTDLLTTSIATGGGGGSGLWAKASVASTAIYLSVFAVNAVHIVSARIRKGRDAAKEAANKYLEDERHAR